MAETIKFWKSDSKGLYADMKLGQKKDISIDFTDFLPAGQTIANGNAVWTFPTGLTMTGNVVNSLICKCFERAVTAGEYACNLTITTDSGEYIEPVPFRINVA